jgi:hypothetical protein
MKNVQMRIKIDQAQAIRDGKNKYGMTVIDINPADLTADQRASLAGCWNEYDREDGLSLPYPQHDFSDMPAVGEATLETARIILDAHAAAKQRAEETKMREREEKVARALTLPLEAFRYGGGGWQDTDWSFRDYDISGVADDPRLAGKIAEAKAEIKQLNAALAISREESKKRRAETDRQKAEKKAAEERAENEKRARQKAQISAWVAANGTDNQKKRAALNLLPEDEIINDIREEAYAPLDGFPRYEKIQKSDIPCTCDDYDEPNITFSAGTETEATAEDFDRMEQIQTVLPAAKLTLRWHRGYCKTCSDPEDDNDGVFERHSIMVALTVGDFDFTREYAV